MVKSIINKSEYAETTPAYIRNNKQYYHLNINPQEIADSDMYVVLSHTYDHYPTQEDKDKLYADYLALCKKVKLAEVEKYDNSENVNAFYVNGQFMWKNKYDRDNLTSSVNTDLIEGATYTTLWADPIKGIKFVLPCEDALQMLRKVELYAKACFNRTAEHKYNITQLVTIEEVENYDYTQGYPEQLRFEV